MKLLASDLDGTLVIGNNFIIHTFKIVLINLKLNLLFFNLF